MTTPHSAPGIGMDAPAVARIYDYVLGGGYHFAADREVAERLVSAVPAYRDFALVNRAFLRRATLHMLDAGIDQFLDLGSGLLSAGPVHEVAHTANPQCRVVYVDNDPIVTAGVELVIAGDPRVGVVHADMCDVRAVLEHPTTRQVLDLDRPVGVLAVAVLHCIPDGDEIRRALAEYHDRLACGTVLAASHGSGERQRPDLTAAAIKVLIDAGVKVVSRTRAEFAALLGSWQPKADGVVPLNWWRPEDTPHMLGDAVGYAVMASSTRQPPEQPAR